MLVTPSLTFVLFGSLREGVSVTDKASQLPGYLSDTFLHLDFGYAPKFHEPRGQVLLDTMPVDIALLVGSLVCGVAIGLAAGLVGGARRRSAADRALAVGSAIGMSMPVYWFSSIVLVLFAPQSGYLLQVPFLSWYGGYVPFADSPLRWLQSLWVPWLVLAAPLAAMVYRMTRASLAEVARRGLRTHGARQGPARADRRTPPRIARRVVTGHRAGLRQRRAAGHERHRHRARVQPPRLLPRGQHRPVQWLGRQGAPTSRSTTSRR